MEERMCEIKEKLNKKFYHMNDTWLNDCLDYYLTENSNDLHALQATDDDTLTFVTAQWQLSDLREISNEKGCLPKNLAAQKSTMLPGKYMLQVEKGYDISTPKYKQLETMRKVSTENIRVTDAEENKPWEIKSKRMMQLFLTDGIQDISAIEYKPIRFLKDIILPGFKIMIKGPVACRRGVILLDESNISEIGGEVEHLLISNATENVFARALNMPENPDPYNDAKQQNDDAALLDDDFDVDFDEITELESAKPKNPSKPPKPPANPPKSSRQSSMTPIDKPKTSDLPVCFEAQTEAEDIDFPDDDDILFDLINDQDMSNNSREFETLQPNSTRNFLNPPEVVKSKEDLIEISDEEPEMKSNPTILNKDTTPRNNTNAAKSKNPSVEFEDFGSMDWDEDEFELESEAMRKIQTPVIPQKKPEVTPKSNITAFFAKTPEPKPPKSSVMKPVTSGPANSSPLASTSRGNSGNFGNSGVTQKRPLETSGLPSGSKLICSKNSSKTPGNFNSRGIRDFFKKSDKPNSNSGNSNEKGIRDYFKKSEPPKICDFICELKKLSLSDGVVRKKVWAKTKSLGKLGKGEGGWTLEGTITDGTDSLEVEYASEVLEKELGFTVAEFAVQKKQRKNDPELEQKLRQTFRIADAKLKTLDALVEIELSLNKKSKVISITDLSDSERNSINDSKKRLGY